MRHHQFDYVEVSVPELSEAKSFYTRAFGWSYNEYGDDYAGIRSADGESGGLANTARGDASSRVLPVIYSEDLDASYTAVPGAGGVITREIFVFPGGRRFEFTDPFGNELAVWSDR